MIDRQEIRDIARTLGLRPNVVEKDYVLGWVLAGIYQRPTLSESWIFKGGTCLKKCYFETYRFSEDLDFTLTDPSHVDHDFLASVFREIGEWIYERTGIEIPEKLQKFEIFKNSRDTVSCQVKLSYRGPIAPSSGGLPRIKLDLTSDEVLVLKPEERVIFHDYSDAPEAGITVLCYAYEEAFAEKVRALGERTRPRDLYDVINLYRNAEARPQAAVLPYVLKEKCSRHGLSVPTLDELETHRSDLEGSWQAMLGHQLQALPPVDSFWDVLPEFFEWLETGFTPALPPDSMVAPDESVLRERTLRLPISARSRPYLEIIRFSAANRLCVDLEYQGSVRRIEPYSLLSTRDGNIVLRAIRVPEGVHRSYRVDRIQGARTTDQSYVPQFVVDLSPQGMATSPPRPIRSKFLGNVRNIYSPATYFVPPTATQSGFSGESSRRYIYECSYCGRSFTRRKKTSKLNPHKDKSGNPCRGRRAIFVDSRY